MTVYGRPLPEGFDPPSPVKTPAERELPRFSPGAAETAVWSRISLETCPYTLPRSALQSMMHWHCFATRSPPSSVITHRKLSQTAQLRGRFARRASVRTISIRSPSSGIRGSYSSRFDFASRVSTSVIASSGNSSSAFEYIVSSISSSACRRAIPSAVSWSTIPDCRSCLIARCESA
jgi:hypothetical protein